MDPPSPFPTPPPPTPPPTPPPPPPPPYSLSSSPSPSPSPSPSLQRSAEKTGVSFHGSEDSLDEHRRKIPIKGRGMWSNEIPRRHEWKKRPEIITIIIMIMNLMRVKQWQRCWLFLVCLINSLIIVVNVCLLFFVFVWYFCFVSFRLVSVWNCQF